MALYHFDPAAIFRSFEVAEPYCSSMRWASDWRKPSIGLTALHGTSRKHYTFRDLPANEHGPSQVTHIA